MVLLGVVQEVQEFELRVSLPGHLQGCVPITNISPAYTAYLRSGGPAQESIPSLAGRYDNPI
jgi:hypothetical protein